MQERNKGGNKIEKNTFWSNACGVDDCRFRPDDGTGIY
jgi:hypothetical protein